MTLVNLFGSLALDQSVMSATPLLKQINTTLTATPYVYVINPSGSFPAIQNVKETGTPVVSVLNTNVGVNNWPATFPTQGIVNVNLANTSTPPTTQNVTFTSTPIVSLANTQVAVQNWPVTYPTQAIVNVNLANVATPPTTQSVSYGASTPLVTARMVSTNNLASGTGNILLATPWVASVLGQNINRNGLQITVDQSASSGAVIYLNLGLTTPNSTTFHLALGQGGSWDGRIGNTIWQGPVVGVIGVGAAPVRLGVVEL